MHIHTYKQKIKLHNIQENVKMCLYIKQTKKEKNTHNLTKNNFHCYCCTRCFLSMAVYRQQQAAAFNTTHSYKIQV